MCNVVSGSAYANSWKLSQCCCGCGLRSGTLSIGWLCLVSGILWIANTAKSGSNANYIGLGSVVLTLLIGIFLLIGIYKLKIKLVWISVYLLLILTIWYLVMGIVFFVFMLLIMGGMTIIATLLNLYFFLVARSYAYEAEEAMPRGNPT